MPRIKLTPPTTVHFSTKLSIRITDLNYGGHLGNDRLLALLHEARAQFFKHFGYTEMNLGESIGIIMSDAAIEYKSEGFGGDELEIKMTAQEFTPKGFDLFYQVKNLTQQKTLALAKTGIVCFDYSKRKIALVPEGFRGNFE